MLYWSRASLAAIEAHRADQASSAETVASGRTRLIVLEDAFRAMAMEMEFGFLFDAQRQLLSIGYSISESALDPNCYDLLASEARLASFFAIAKGDVPARHWFRLGRAATPVSRGTALISWSGSMFEYLMPPLVMRAPAGSLLEQTDRLDRAPSDRIWRRSCGLPWGVSESAYNARDLDFTYQYSNFGVPGLGLKRGLGENSVVAPYATGLATMVDPSAAAANFKRSGRNGRARAATASYEAVDFTPTRVQEGETFAIVRAFMAHHQGMTIVGDRQRALRRRDARAISCRADHSGDRIVVAGAGSPRGRLDPAVGSRRSSLPRAPARPIPRAGAGSSLRINPSPRPCCSPTAATP